ncbi:MAG: N(5)-(carboxyethyl)ornithine synthase [Atopostipes suicloacalis]|nr:N(5)-(carboxyethyl)ornithine synthase [Atopostipes suicloacalis]
MKTIAFIVSDYENESRRALLPEDIQNIQHKENLFIEESYGEVLGYEDAAYEKMGAQIVSRKTALSKDIICDLKINHAQYLKQLVPKQSVFGWLHAETNSELTQLLVEKKLTAIAWEKMYDAGRHVFWKNNHIAGEAAILHAFTLFGKLANECKVALLGRGNVSMGAHKTLSALGADVKIFNRDTVPHLTEELADFDMVVNGVMWDKSREDHLIYKKDLSKFKDHSMIVDISADENGAIETSRPRNFKDPIYEVENVIHYTVNHTPTIYNRSVSRSISREVSTYIDPLIEEKVKENQVLSKAMVIENGKILRDKIKKAPKQNISNKE